MYLIVVNAERPKMKRWMEDRISGFGGTREPACFDGDDRGQGPAALDALDGVIGREFVRSLRPRRCGETDWRGILFASRTGYTGRTGWKLVTTPTPASPLAGLARRRRDALRAGEPATRSALEAALLLYGNDDGRRPNPSKSASIGRDLEDGVDFIGAGRWGHRAAVWRTLVCLKAQDRASCAPIATSSGQAGAWVQSPAEATPPLASASAWDSSRLNSKLRHRTDRRRAREGASGPSRARPFYKRSKKESA
jgi:glycine cleavage system aminomethyltransferase T